MNDVKNANFDKVNTVYTHGICQPLNSRGIMGWVTVFSKS